jgi:hypothetical protein
MTTKIIAEIEACIPHIVYDIIIIGIEDKNTHKTGMKPNINTISQKVSI